MESILGLTDCDRLRVKLRELSVRERETASTCWDDFADYSCVDLPIGGLKFAAWKYTYVPRKLNQKKNPHEIEAELHRLSSSVGDLRAKLEGISAGCLDWILSFHGNNSFPLCDIDPEGKPIEARRVGFDDFREFYGLTSVGMEAWFLSLRWPRPLNERAPVVNISSLSLKNGRLKELGALCKLFDAVAEEVAKKKQAPNGLRGNGKRYSNKIDDLIATIGKIVCYRKRPFSHILPIARKIHEWANNGEILGLEWGQRPFERIKPMLKSLKWREAPKDEIGRMVFSRRDWDKWTENNLKEYRKSPWDLKLG